MSVRTIGDIRSDLGEGPLWHENRFFWFDINNKLLHACEGDGSAHQQWDMGEHASAAARLEDGNLIIASESEFFHFDPRTGERHSLAPLEANNPATRSNDGRADRRGGFWVGTMGKRAEEGAGAFYRYYRGEVRLLYPNATIPNATCFSPDGGTAYFTDTRTRKIMQQALDSEGWPVGEPEVFFELTDGPGAPDGAVVDSTGHLWCALYGGSAVIRISPDGEPVERMALPVPNPTCPAFGGPDLKTVYVTSAKQGMDPAALAAAPLSGAILAYEIEVPGLPEPVISL